MALRNATHRRTCLAALLLGLTPLAQAESPLVIGTASPTGVYHITGQSLCRLLEAPCEARTSGGSVDNLAALRDGELEIALAQSDLHYHATQGIEGFAEAGPDNGLRALFSVHSEPFTLVVRRDAGIAQLTDLAQRSVNIGNPGSGQRGTMLQLMDAQGWTLDDFAVVNELPADQQSLELCHGRVEAMVYTVGHPDASIAQAIRLCDAAIVDIKGDAVEALIAADRGCSLLYTRRDSRRSISRRPGSGTDLRRARDAGGQRVSRPRAGLRPGRRAFRQLRALHLLPPRLLATRAREHDP